MYPESIDKFTEKLNKLEGNTYVIEEEVDLKDGVYEGELQHDNISNTSVRVYTGPKLTGDKIENFILSTPSLTPWKKTIKIFAKEDKCYITYETQGDTIEAEDINKVQESISNTQIEVEKYKSSNNLEVKELKNKVDLLKNNKAEKTYVDTQLLKKADKDNVFTKEEVLQKIKDLIGTAPQTLDTFKEIADALGNDPNFATTIMNLLSTKVDKVQGKGLSTEDYTAFEKEKLAGINQGANKYIHPSSHSADVIVESTNKKFVTNSEKNTWNNKADKDHVHENLNISHGNEINIVNGFNNDDGTVILNYRGANKPIKKLRIYNGQKNGLACMQALTFINTNGDEVAYKKDLSIVSTKFTWNDLKGV